MIILPILTTSLIHFLFKGWENVLFELGSVRVKQLELKHTQGAEIHDTDTWYKCYLEYVNIYEMEKYARGARSHRAPFRNYITHEVNRASTAKILECKCCIQTATLRVGTESH